ncbi:NAD(P)-dependent oxidoreductase [Nonomuraea sp. NPDC050310]|uniref:NAD-dependent epimerase/dehydratase family protein n=1 Tax=Nonomuraea sp. NPDC050310 TaxID=3154935 RepID=UPI0033DE353D
MIVLLGGSGFIGRHVEAALRELTPQDVVVLPRGEDPRPLTPKVVINCAGATRGRPGELVAANVVLVSRLLAMIEPGTRLLHVGSATEYGRVPMGPPVTEETTCLPVTPYALTKLTATELIRASEAEATVLRPFNVVGPGATMVGKLVRDLRAGGDLVVGGLELYRDFVDVRDVARAVALAALSDESLPPVLNLGGGEATAVRDLVSTLVELAGPGRRVTPGETAPEAVPWLCADATAAGQALGWRPEISLRQALQHAWEFTGEAAGQQDAPREPEEAGDE